MYARQSLASVSGRTSLSFDEAGRFAKQCSLTYGQLGKTEHLSPLFIIVVFNDNK
jgi:hypothetical protein